MKIKNNINKIAETINQIASINKGTSSFGTDYFERFSFIGISNKDYHFKEGRI